MRGKTELGVLASLSITFNRKQIGQDIRGIVVITLFLAYQVSWVRQQGRCMAELKVSPKRWIVQFGEW